MGGGALTDFATTRRSGPPESKPPSLNARERGGDAPPLSSEAPTNGARGAPAIAAAPGWPAHRTTSHALLFVTLWRRFQGGPTHGWFRLFSLIFGQNIGVVNEMGTKNA